ncbi:thymidylate synthase [Pyrobaculum sp.]|uniref:thymidylate synthase n=1 Tax=Pyrobaculum sp. TaxID=2004705 RepID=UPI003D0DA976
MSNILLIVLWRRAEDLPLDIREKAAYVGTAYSADVVNHVIKALYETYTHVDTVIVYGPDLSGAGDYVVQALRGECNDAVRVPCQYIKELGVQVVDLRWRDDNTLREVVATLYKPRNTPARERREVALEPPDKRLQYQGPHVIYDPDPATLRAKAVDYILTYGVETRDVIYSVLILQRGDGGGYAAGPCDLLEDWPCGLGRADVFMATPAYVKKRELQKAAALVDVGIYGRDVYDPHGNFVLADSLYHYSPRGVLLRQIELTEVNVRREAQKLLPDHAFYLGREYAAYRILKERYVQDRWKGEF